MAKLNPDIILSMTNDLSDLHEISKEMIQQIGALEINSWRYPDRASKDIEIVIETEVFDTGDYVLLLELIIDRLYLIINMTLNILNSTTEVSNSNFYKLPQNIAKPVGISFGTLISFLWKRLQKLMYHNTEKNECVIMNKSQFPTIKTENLLNYACENCFRGFSLLKNLIKNVEEFMILLKIDSKTTECRKVIQEDILKLTQIEAMNQWTKALISDIAEIIDFAKTKWSENSTLNNELNEFNKENEFHLKKFQLLQQKYMELEKINEESELQLEASIQTNQELTEKCNYFSNELEKSEKQCKMKDDDLEEVENKINEIIASREKTIEIIKSEFSTQLLNTTSEQESFKKLYIESKNKIEELEANINEERKKQAILLNALEKYKDQMEVCEEEMTSMDAENKELLQKVEENNLLEQEYVQKIKLLEEETIQLKSDLAKSKEREIVLLRYPDLNGAIDCPNVNDPYEDMKNQLEANELRIELLQNQNENLQRVITKMKKLPCRMID